MSSATSAASNDFGSDHAGDSPVWPVVIIIAMLLVVVVIWRGK